VTSLAATLTVNSPPTITGQPSGATRNVGDSVTFSVVATGTDLTYQWRKGGVIIGGATTSSYTIAAVALADAGSYDCLVSGVCGPPVTSQVATLTVNPAGVAPSITVQPQSRTNLAGTTATFSVTASGSAPLSYQWRFNDTNLVDGARISGTASSSLALSSVQTNDAGSYTVIITNAFGSVTSQVAMLTLKTGASGTKRWEFAAGAEVVSSPAIGADGTVYVGCNDGKVYALEGATGVKRWEFATAVPFGYSSPAIGIDGTVYVASLNVYALDGATGAKRWEFVAPEEPATSPAIGADGTVYVGTRGALYALNGGTGALCWRLNTGYVESSPSVGSDGTIYFAGYGKIYAVDGVTGVIRWSSDIGDSSSYSSLAIGADGTIYTGCSRWGNYNIGNNRVCAFDGATGAKRWEVATASWIYSSAAIGVDGTVYIASEDAKVLALDGATGAQRWAFTPTTGFMCSPAIGADNTIYIGAGDGKLRALDGATGTKRWEFATGGSIQSSAAIAADGTLYFGSNDRKVYALSSSSVGGPASSPWPMFRQNARRTGRVETGSPTAPLITAQPQSRTNSVGTTATFSVAATGTEPLSYQWRRNSVNLSDGGNVSGATTPTLTLANVQPAEAANYQVIVTNAFGSAASYVATLTLSGTEPGTKRWEFYDLFLGSSPTPAIGADGTVYVGAYSDGVIYALDGATGSQRWRLAWISTERN
jgi:outer membrane protein assembly factor BamB